jgi:hypothetical protein
MGSKGDELWRWGNITPKGKHTSGTKCTSVSEYGCLNKPKI